MLFFVFNDFRVILYFFLYGLGFRYFVLFVCGFFKFIYERKERGISYKRGDFFGFIWYKFKSFNLNKNNENSYMY